MLTASVFRSSTIGVSWDCEDCNDSQQTVYMLLGREYLCWAYWILICLGVCANRSQDCSYGMTMVMIGLLFSSQR